MVANVNPRRCLEVAKAINGVVIPLPVEDVPLLPFSKEEEANFWFFLAAICHQTSPVGESPLCGVIDGTQKVGWDFLLHTFRRAVVEENEWLWPERWTECTAAGVCSLFGSLISRPDRRAELIRDLAKGLKAKGWRSVIEAGHHCEFRIAPGVPKAAPGDISESGGAEAQLAAPVSIGLLDFLSGFDAFADPVQKKSVFFLMLMRNANLWSYVDEMQLPAPVDYHEIRGHLRIGTVELSAGLRQKIANRCAITSVEDTAIRFAVREAIGIISADLKTSSAALHYFLWNLFRTYCCRSRPVCDGSRHSSLPAVYRESLTATGDCQCPFRPVCDSADLSEAINEPGVDTDFY